MNEPTFIFRDIAMVFAGAFMAGLLFWRLRQPMVLGYVFAGLILSPLTPGPRIHNVHTFQIMAEVGVILLMFSVGIEFSIPELLRVKWVALVGAPAGICLCIGLGAGTGILLGWPLAQGIAVGCIVSVASTMVLMSLLMDRGEIGSEAGRIMVALTLVDDLAVVILIALLPGLDSSTGADYAQVLWKISKAVLLLVPVVFAGWKIVPRLLARVERTCNDEVSLLLALTVCLVVEFSTFLAIADYRLRPPEKTIIKFEERTAGSPQAIKGWFYPGRTDGHEFVYPKTEALALARVNHTPVPSMPAELAISTTKQEVSIGGPEVIALMRAPLKAEEPTGEEVEIAEAFPAADSSAPAAHAVPNELPSTASAAPLLGLIGLLSAGTAIALRFAGVKAK